LSLSNHASASSSNSVDEAGQTHFRAPVMGASQGSLFRQLKDLFFFLRFKLKKKEKKKKTLIMICLLDYDNNN
jgi:hypothetical protein